MATGLEAFGVACNVMQTIQFTTEALRVCKKIYEGHSPTPEVESRCSELNEAAKSLEHSLMRSSVGVGHEDDKELRRIATELLATTK